MKRMEKEIIERLKKSGYPLEIKVTLTLESRKWNVLNQEGYRDPESGKWRTIDILATKAIELSSSSSYRRLHTSLLIECKKMETSWVFWVRQKRTMRIFDPIVAYGLIKSESKPQLDPLQFEKLAGCFHYYRSEFDKVALISIEPWKKGKEALFEAKNQVIKCLLYKRERLRDFLLREQVLGKIGVIKEKMGIMSLFFPVIIVDGLLYEMEFLDEEPKLKPVNYIQYLTSFGVLEPEYFVIDIVRIDFLEKYLDIIEETVKQLAKNLPLIRPSK